MRIRSLFWLVLIWASSVAQGPTAISFQQAIDLAGQQAYSVQNSEKEVIKAQHQLREIVGLGLPQINGSAGFSDYLDIPVQVAENFFGGTDDLVELQFGLQYGANAGVQLDQLIFDGSYLVGLQASKAFKLNKELELEQAVHDAKAAAAKAYYAVLVAREGVENLEKLLPVLEENFRQVKALQENGFADITDVNRQELGVGELNTQLLVLRNKEFSAMDMLHFLLGMPLKTPIELTSELEELLQDPDPRTLAAAAFDENQHIDSRVAESLVVLQQLTVKNERAANLPKFYGFLSHQQNAYRREFDIFSNGPWYPTTILGVNLQIPIYSGGIRHQKIQQARIAEEQVMLNQEIVNQQLLLDVSQMQKAVLDAADQYDFQKRNMELATDIFERTNAKYREGVASSFELTEERTQLLNSNNAYTQSLADLLLARANLRKALGIF